MTSFDMFIVDNQVEGVSYTEIAATLHISIAAAKVKIHRARLRLASQGLGGELGGVLPPGKSAVLPPGKSVVLPRGNCSVRACPCPPPQSNRLRRRTVSPATSARYAPSARMM